MVYGGDPLLKPMVDTVETERSVNGASQVPQVLWKWWGDAEFCPDVDGDGCQAWQDDGHHQTTAWEVNATYPKARRMATRMGVSLGGRHVEMVVPKAV